MGDKVIRKFVVNSILVDKNCSIVAMGIKFTGVISEFVISIGEVLIREYENDQIKISNGTLKVKEGFNLRMLKMLIESKNGYEEVSNEITILDRITDDNNNVIEYKINWNGQQMRMSASRLHMLSQWFSLEGWEVTDIGLGIRTEDGIIKLKEDK